MDHQPVDRGRRAERGHPVPGHQFEELVRVELAAEIVDEHRGSGEPLAVKLAPRRLGPAAVGNRQVDVVRPEIVPVHRGHAMTERVVVIVLDHLRRAGRSGREENEKRIGAARRLADRAGAVFAACAKGIEVNPSLRRPGAAHLHRQLNGGARGAGFVHLVRHRLVDDRALDPSELEPVLDILDADLRREGHGNRAQLVQREETGPELHAAIEH